MSDYYSPTQHRKRSTVSSQSSCDEGVPSKRRALSSSTSYENNIETSSQSEADTTSQVSENAGTTDATDSSSESESDVPTTAMDYTRQSVSDDYSETRPTFSGQSFSMTGNDMSYRTSGGSEKNLMEEGGVAAKLMARMGYQTGTGLGKHAQGRVEPVASSKHKGRRGLGMAPTNFELDSDLAWRDEEVSCKETIEWLPPQVHNIPELEELQSWVSIGDKKLTIDDETEFVEPSVLSGVLGAKTVFDNLEAEEMRKARTHSNPFELIKGVIFQNRAAMKMANMDSAFNFMFTMPKERNGGHLVKSGELLYFADICAGPGGFSEYVLWRKKWKCKGFGLTLKSGRGVNDFKLEEFFVSPSECFEPHYGKGGIEGDGDIYKQENIDIFSAFVKENSRGKGVHFVMADGGFSVEGQENVQEVLSKRLYLCQFLCAIAILREQGHFVCKLFDVFTSFSVGLVYLMRYAFDEVCIMKPVTSRPANSERYIVCKGFRSNSGDVLRQYLTYINTTFDHVNFGSTRQTDCIQHIVPLHMLKEDAEFYEYICNSNYELGRLQCLNLKKIQVYAKNPDLRDMRQTEIRDQCLEIWKVPNKMRSAPEKGNPASKAAALLQEDLAPLGESTPRNLAHLKKEIRSIFDYKVIVSGTKGSPHLTQANLSYFLSMGRSMVFKWDGCSAASWKRVTDDDSCHLQLDIPRDTIFVAEVVQELKGEGKGQKRLNALHITDVLFLYGEDYRPYSINARLDAAQLFVAAITKTSRTKLTPIRVKHLYKIEELPSLLSSHLDYRILKGCGSDPKLCYNGDTYNQDSYYHAFVGLYFIPYVYKPWTMAYSRKSQRKYVYNTDTKASAFDIPKQSFANTNCSLTNRMLLTDRTVSTRDGLGNLTVDLDEWIKTLAPWLATS